MRKTLKKTIFLGAASVMMLSSFSGCGKEAEQDVTEAVTEAITEADANSDTNVETETTEAASETESTEAETEEATVEATAGFTLPDKFVYDGEFEVEVVGFEYFDTKEDYEYDIFNVYFDMTSLDDSLKTVRRVYMTATQEGEELEMDPLSNSTYGNCEFQDLSFESIQQGVTVRYMESFAAKKGSTDIIKVGIGKADGEYEYFDVDPTWDMPDMRAEKYEYAKIDSPAYGPGNMPEGSDEDRYDIKINGITGYSTGTGLDRHSDIVEHTVVGISYTITNNTDKEESPFMLFSSQKTVFQDGVALIDTSAGKESEDHGKTQQDLPLYQKIAPGETVDFVQYYKLRSDSPIEVVFKDFISKEIFADMVYEVDPSSKGE